MAKTQNLTLDSAAEIIAQNLQAKIQAQVKEKVFAMFEQDIEAIVKEAADSLAQSIVKAYHDPLSDKLNVVVLIKSSDQ